MFFGAAALIRRWRVTAIAVTAAILSGAGWLTGGAHSIAMAQPQAAADSATIRVHLLGHAIGSEHTRRLVSVNATKDYQSRTRQGSPNGCN
jgi:hypothetical protein